MIIHTKYILYFFTIYEKTRSEKGDFWHTFCLLKPASNKGLFSLRQVAKKHLRQLDDAG